MLVIVCLFLVIKDEQNRWNQKYEEDEDIRVHEEKVEYEEYDN